ncbi:hypothetical protein PHYBLDRAFT_168021 [Phycomyces blakesleeanus NRRL 1555(-)]|uniref:Uncharacterized protein n=1 Tax=Phycomyces blakesleeanus (strain ATCC 8743b / DSM 1359 / FGSC 10004 / NBRC 33097 / NRRL 1555) TaxID=763407 RepID=A0A163DUV9_PHYB8|nr:hypothetical protein PHYBLDRAFT_168021 [Phycomyces blakesleeanus NRRL 1555(-)]OAD73580.1 hypothetical protein PHYBLDRAFT_168021 [Phycomyces blakesleeanus NRRL 1555(-)]|eukprot:XP_018291620.1 hypothetical protein PHYBLDRAFT_168021 [Phycomyces blakesleeanus NRRL 1555(-)]
MIRFVAQPKEPRTIHWSELVDCLTKIEVHVNLYEQATAVASTMACTSSSLLLTMASLFIHGSTILFALFGVSGKKLYTENMTLDFAVECPKIDFNKIVFITVIVVTVINIDLVNN